MELKDICYKKNFLTDVIIRIDFQDPLEEIIDELNEEIVNKLSEIFPIFEIKIVKDIGVGINMDDPKKPNKVLEKTTKHYEFYNNDRSLNLNLNYNSFSIVFNKYKNFNDFFECFLKVFDNVYQSYPNIQIKRLGLRYINNIEIKGKTFNWKGFLNSKLTSSLDFINNKETISRVFNAIVFYYDTYNVIFQYGMWNPDFPSKIKKKLFVLDFDAHMTGMLSKEDIKDKTPEFHNKIQELFELSIGNKLRSYLYV